MTKIVITQDLNLSSEQIARLEKLGELKLYDDIPTTDDEWLERTKGYDIISAGQFGLRTRYQELHDKFISLSYVGVGFMDATIKRMKHGAYKVLSTPHIAYNTTASAKVGNDMMIDNIEAWLAGWPINVVASDGD